MLLCRSGGKGRGGGGIRHIEAGKEAAMEAEMHASRERAVVPLETRVQQFMQMLTEKEVMLNVFPGPPTFRIFSLTFLVSVIIYSFYIVLLPYFVNFKSVR